ncbi:MAG: DUF3332 domain-containing protein [Candidatus Limisoma sp.]|nr:DUF3332 domain-containing protein [Candidatus Limisoma sp.]
MKKRIIPVCAIVLASSLLFTSCIGSFKMTNKVLAWNSQISNKFVNELVFFGLWVLPVYEISALADMLVINSIEFWSGSNPIAQGQKTIEDDNGRYLLAWDETGYTITNESTGEVTRLNFNIDKKSWSVATPEGDITFLTFIDDSHVSVPAGDGSYTIVELSEEGVLAYRDMINYTNLASIK